MIVLVKRCDGALDTFVFVLCFVAVEVHVLYTKILKKAGFTLKVNVQLDCLKVPCRIS